MTGLEIGLIAPPAMGLLFLAAITLIARANGDLNQHTFKALLACAGLITFAGYLVMWWQPIEKLWSGSPLTTIVCGVLISVVPLSLFVWIRRLQVQASLGRTSSADTSDHHTGSRQ